MLSVSRVCYCSNQTDAVAVGALLVASRPCAHAGVNSCLVAMIGSGSTCWLWWGSVCGMVESRCRAAAAAGAVQQQAYMV